MSDVLDELWKSRHEKDVLFLEIINGYYTDTFINMVFYIKNGTYLLMHNLHENYIWINYDLFSNPFIGKFGLNENNIFSLLNGLIEIHLNLKNIKMCKSRDSSIKFYHKKCVNF